MIKYVISELPHVTPTIYSLAKERWKIEPQIYTLVHDDGTVEYTAEEPDFAYEHDKGSWAYV